jgi:hypothetical protein
MACKFVQSYDTEGKHGKLFSVNVQASSGILQVAYSMPIAGLFQGCDLTEALL